MTRARAPRDRAADAGELSDGAHLLHRAMRLAVAHAVERLAAEGLPSRDALLLDVGGRGRPYADVMSSGLGPAGYRVRHVVVDRDPGADVVGRAERLPVASGSADLVLCTQVLEHVADPTLAVSEMARVLRPAGACLLTTHGAWFYHPDPVDYWRWTPAGLAVLFAGAGFRQVAVAPVGGTKLALAALGLTALERGVGGGAAAWLVRRLVVAPANRLASRWLLGRVTGRTSLPGELVINYLVTARL